MDHGTFSASSQRAAFLAQDSPVYGVYDIVCCNLGLRDGDGVFANGRLRDERVSNDCDGVV